MAGMALAAAVYLGLHPLLLAVRRRMHRARARGAWTTSECPLSPVQLIANGVCAFAPWQCEASSRLTMDGLAAQCELDLLFVRWDVTQLLLGCPAGSSSNAAVARPGGAARASANTDRHESSCASRV